MDHFDPALISAVMLCHNAAPYAGEAIASVLGQRYLQVERAFRKAARKAGDLKRLIASLLPAPLYRDLDFVTQRRSVRIEW